MYVPGKPFHLSIMFAGEAGAYPSGAYFSFSPLGKALGLACKHYTRMEKLHRDKNSCLLQTFLNYGRKNFYNTGPWSNTTWESLNNDAAS